MWTAAGRLIAALAFGAALAISVILVGTGDVESYEHAVFSLDRGTSAQTVRVFGQPVYTLALGLGVRLPLHGSLGASPAALVAPHVPAPLTYALLLTFAIAPALLLLRHALESTCGRLVSWLASVLLFCSVPMVNYTIYDDWPETALTFCAYVVCVCAPHAMLAVMRPAHARATRRLAASAVGATVWAFLALAHPGHWPLLAIALVSTAIVTLVRVDHAWDSRLAVVTTLTIVSASAVALPAVDILREFAATVARGDTDRAVDLVPAGVLASNLFPFGEVGARLPFSYVVLAALSAAVGFASSPAHMRQAIVTSALAALALAFGTSVLSPRGSVSAYAPSATWALRDPASVFAVLSGAWAVAAVWRSSSHRLRWAAAGLLVVGSLQGLAYAVSLVIPELTHEESWTRDWTPREERVWARGLDPDRLPPGGRLALWPDVRQQMRSSKLPSTDFADAGYLLVTAWTKQRAMRSLIEPNGVLFNQTIEPPAPVLCNEQAVRFLRLRYLIRPADVGACDPWSPIPDIRVDDRFEVDTIGELDNRVRALPVARLADPTSREPALSADSTFWTAIEPLPGTSMTIGPSAVALRLADPSVAKGHALVLPVAYDQAWRTSSGQLHDVGGLLTLVGVDQREVRLEFVPDLAAVLRALSMTLAQILAVGGTIGLAFVAPGSRADRKSRQIV
jgi:hypothetical protein